MRKKLIVGNWKMHADLHANAALLAALASASGGVNLRGVDMAVAPPAPYLAQAQAALRGTPIALAAQDVSQHAGGGAYTGEWSAAMLQDFGVRYAIVGHSERRKYHGETDAHVAAKAQAALACGIAPIVCLGESLGERQSGQTEAVVMRQLAAITQALGPRSSAIVLAYEPVWAIGTGEAATPAQAQAVHALLRGALAAQHASGIPILYGGSMNAGNAAQLLAQADIDGGLIGSAALKAAEFLSIAEAAAQSFPFLHHRSI